MRIALLNLPFDNNFGGSLQRYALVKVLQAMGHEVIHINLIENYHLPWWKVPYSYPKRILRRYIFRKSDRIFIEKYFNKQLRMNSVLMQEFYKKYIPHTDVVVDIQGVKRVCAAHFDAYIVGSDQVWRKNMTRQIGLANYLFKFVTDVKAKRIAYAVSLGTDKNELTESEIVNLTKLYKKFNAVSVREVSALKLLRQYGWNSPQAITALDPTLLLSVDDYLKLMRYSEKSSTTSSEIYCYILDMTEQKRMFIEEKSCQLQKNYKIINLDGFNKISVEDWLTNIYEAEVVITDSYHGTVFSILFNKPFLFLGNEKRGNTRIQSLFQSLEIEPDATLFLDWSRINQKIYGLRKEAECFLMKALE